jgi:hypothetical protein
VIQGAKEDRIERGINPMTVFPHHPGKGENLREMTIKKHSIYEQER